jgi:hypothetical protein
MVGFTLSGASQHLVYDLSLVCKRPYWVNGILENTNTNTTYNANHHARRMAQHMPNGAT